MRGQAADLLRRLVQRPGARGRAQGVALGAPGLGDVVDDDVEVALPVGPTYESVLDGSVAPLLDPAQPVQEGEGAAADGGGAGSVCHALILCSSRPDEGRPTRGAAVAVAVVYGLAWVAMSYARGGDPLAWPWQRPIMMGVGLILAFGEEIAVRGLILDRLERCGTGFLVQIVTTGAVVGVYHGVVGHHVWPSYMISSFVLFGLLSALYMYGRRSLTPPLIAHAMTHFLGDPTLMRGILYGVALAG